MIKHKKIKEFLIMFVVQIFSYGIICINLRAVAHGNILLAASSDFIFASANFVLIKKIATSDDTIHQWLGYSLGSVVGTVIGIHYSNDLLQLIK